MLTRIFLTIIVLELLIFLDNNGIQYIGQCILEFYDHRKQKRIDILEQKAKQIRTDISKTKNRFKCLCPYVPIRVNPEMNKRQVSNILSGIRKQFPRDICKMEGWQREIVNLLINLDDLFYKRDEYENEITRLINQNSKLIFFLRQRTSKKIINPQKP